MFGGRLSGESDPADKSNRSVPWVACPFQTYVTLVRSGGAVGRFRRRGTGTSRGLWVTKQAQSRRSTASEGRRVAIGPKLIRSKREDSNSGEGDPVGLDVGGHGIIPAEFADGLAGPSGEGTVFGAREDRDNPGRDLTHPVLAEPSGGQRRGPHPNAAGVERLPLVERDQVLVDRDPGPAQGGLGDLAGEPPGRHVDQDQVVIGPARDQAETGLHQLVGQNLGVGDHLGGIRFEVGTQGLAEADRLAGDHVHQRPSLEAGENRRVDLLGSLLGAENDPASRAAQSLVGGAGDVIRHRDRVGMETGGDQAGDVGHVDKKDRADLASDLGDPVEVDRPGVGAGAGEDQLRLVLSGEGRDVVVVDPLGLGVEAVADRGIPPAGEVELHPVGQVAAVGEVHRQDGVARLEAGIIDRLIGRGPGMRLDVGVLGAEELLGPVDRQPLDLVDELATAVIPLAGQTLGVLVGQDRADGLHDGGAGVILRGDQLELVALANFLVGDRVEKDRVGVFQEIHDPSGMGS